MTIIKERCLYNNRCIIRSNTYSHHLPYFLQLVAEAKKDFPQLKDEDIEVVQYAGQRYKGTFGIEFFPRMDIPTCYEDIAQLEFTL